MKVGNFIQNLSFILPLSSICLSCFILQCQFLPVFPFLLIIICLIHTWCISKPLYPWLFPYVAALRGFQLAQPPVALLQALLSDGTSGYSLNHFLLSSSMKRFIVPILEWFYFYNVLVTGNGKKGTVNV